MEPNLAPVVVPHPDLDDAFYEVHTKEDHRSHGVDAEPTVSSVFTG